MDPSLQMGESPVRHHLAAPGVSQSPNVGHDHSTLEVVPGPDYDKQVAVGPDYDKEVVPQPYVLPPHSQNYWPHGLEQNKDAWGAGEGADTGVGRGKRAMILGLKRKTFFIVASVGLIAVAIAIGLGAGLGATRGSGSSGSGGVDAGAAGVSTSASDSLPPNTSLPTQTSPSTSGTSTSPASSITSPPSTSTARSSSTTLSAQSTASVQVGGVGGRCTNQWGGDCICLDQGICRNKWKGTPYTGTPGNRPCPNDPEDIMACVVQPCLGQVAPAQCLWREACRQLNPGTNSAPICPGGDDFVCCAHSW